MHLSALIFIFCFITSIQTKPVKPAKPDQVGSTDVPVIPLTYPINKCLEHCQRLDESDPEFPVPVSTRYTTYYGSWCTQYFVTHPRQYALACGLPNDGNAWPKKRYCLGICERGFKCEEHQENDTMVANCVKDVSINVPTINFCLDVGTDHLSELCRTTTST